MKIISIGRNPDCNIIYDDNMVSRRHAIIKILPLGKYQIVSTGTNGTKVNGVRITDNAPYPVKRGDSVVFASSSRLDWSQVPDPLKPFRLALWIVLAVILAGGLTFGIVKIVDHFSGSETTETAAPLDMDGGSPAPADTAKTAPVPAPVEGNAVKPEDKPNDRVEQPTRQRQHRNNRQQQAQTTPAPAAPESAKPQPAEPDDDEGFQGRR